MRVSKQQAAANKARVVEIAAQRFRERGFDGIGVADLMQDAGLTHGGFYGQFESKEDLAAQACAQAMAESAASWRKAADAAPKRPREAAIAQYLSPRHRDHPGRGCLLPALAAEIPRREPVVRRAFTEGFKGYIAEAMRTLPPANKTAQRKQALAILSSLVGAVILARAVDDPALSNDILRATAEQLE
jgi:TetR/AcrR family transcriptional repressor of nem operon